MKAFLMMIFFAFLSISCSENSSTPDNNTEPEGDKDTGIYFFDATVNIDAGGEKKYEPTWTIHNQGETKIYVNTQSTSGDIFEEYGFEMAKKKGADSTKEASFSRTVGAVTTIYSGQKMHYEVKRLTDKEIEGIFTFSGKSQDGKQLIMTGGRFSFKLPD